MSEVDIRSKLLSAKVEFKKKEVDADGVKVEVRQPSVKARKDLFAKSSKNGEIDSTDFMVWSTIYNTFDPVTNKRVFEDTDYEALLDRPIGGWLDKIAEAAGELMNTGGVDSSSKN